MPVTNMADAIIDSVPLVDPYSKAGTKQLNKQFGVKKANKRLERAQNNYRQTIAKSSGFTDALNKIIERKQPLNQQLANAATDFSSVENPFVRADLMDRAESAIRGSRNNALGQGVEALTSLASAKQYGISNLQNSLSQKLSNRDQARQFAGTQYLDQLNFNRQQTQREQDRQFQYDLLARQREEQQKAYEDQQAYDKANGIGNYAPRSSGGSGSSSPNMQFKELVDGTVGYFNPDTGEFVPTGATTTPQEPDYSIVKDSSGNPARIDMNTGEVTPVNIPGASDNSGGFVSDVWSALFGKGK